MNQTAKGKKAVTSSESTLKIETQMEPATAPDPQHSPDLERLLLPEHKANTTLPRLKLVPKDAEVYQPHKASTTIFTTSEEYDRRIAEFSLPSKIMKYGGYKSGSWRTEVTELGIRHTTQGVPSEHFERLLGLYSQHAELIKVHEFEMIYEKIYDPFTGPLHEEEWDILTRKTVRSTEEQETAMKALQEKKFQRLSDVVFEVAQERMHSRPERKGIVDITPMLGDVKRNGYDYD